MIDADPASGLVKVGGGTVLADLNEELHRLGLAMENLGDIDRQTIAGAISTGTHGTGAKLRNISAQVEAIELVLADGSVRELSARRARAAAGGAGRGRRPRRDLGGDPALRPRLHPATGSTRRSPREEVLDSFQERADANDHFELFTFPYADSALVLERNRTDGTAAAARPRSPPTSTTSCSRTGRWRRSRRPASWFPDGDPARSRGSPPRSPRAAGPTDRSDRVFANERRVRFTEMEYGVPREHGPEAARRVIEWVRANRYPVFFPIEMRVTAGDDALLSPSHERDTAYIAVHQYRGMEWRPYFEAVEEIMNDYGGRPHWGKRHFQTAETLAPRYPALGGVPGAPATSSTPAASSPTSTRTRGPRPARLDALQR